MKILFDEDAPKPLAQYFPVGVEIRTAQQMGWSGKANGELLRLAAAASFEGIITLDRNMEHQLNPQSLPIAVIVLRGPRQELTDFANLVTTQVIPLLEAGAEKRIYRFG